MSRQKTNIPKFIDLNIDWILSNPSAELNLNNNPNTPIRHLGLRDVLDNLPERLGIKMNMRETFPQYADMTVPQFKEYITMQYNLCQKQMQKKITKEFLQKELIENYDSVRPNVLIEIQKLIKEWKISK